MNTTQGDSAYDHLFKILIVGESGVGKSCLLLRFCDDEFNEKQLSTIGVDFKVKHMTLQQKKLKLAIWDTAGQERFRTLTSSYYRGAHGIILVYDASRRETFDNLQFWLDEIRKYSTNADAVKMLVGNKVDQPLEVTREEGEEFAFAHSMLFIETSAKTRKGVKQAFEELVHKILDNPALVNSTAPLAASSSAKRTLHGAGGEEHDNPDACVC